MIYLNNAATSWPKPQCVIDTLVRYAQGMPDGQMRSSLETEEENIMEACRRSLSRLLGVKRWDRIFFTSGATESANLFLRGMDWTDCRIYVAQTEHNCFLRPLWNLPGLRERTGILPCDRKGYVKMSALSELPSGKGAVIISHCSNVTGAVQPMGEIADIVKKKGYLLAVDVSQSAGCMPVEGDAWKADILIFTGHKSLMGPQGTGGIYIREGLPVRPLKYGGTGRESGKLLYAPGEYDYEPGTQNLPGIAALRAGADYVYEFGVEKISRKERENMAYLQDGLKEIPGIHLFGPENTEPRGPILSFGMDGLTPADISYILKDSYGIIVREGLQCAPLIHECIGSGKEGTVRVSISCATGREEIDALTGAVREIGGALTHAD
ncbi:MAG TPA: aminotransferase class V-fold PLP-dependent enzyme [Candidatus Eisenbergiella stercoravium]|nr:aminotransferase class V-fold PLP-dependent enzyme [Candidatus Eisenbergiella stercoravium]